MNGPVNTDVAVARFQPRTDPTTFEVLRHRLWQINDEQGQTVLNVSGSQVATEANDFNVAIADAEGNLVVIGPYILAQVAPLSLLVQNVIKSLGDQVAEGDMYLCNDPWFGAVHQNDVCVLAPLYWQGRLIAWTGSVVHQMDVGGAAPGSWCHEATETFQEAPRYRFLRVVRDGRTQREVVDTYLTNSRTPDMLELDLRAQIAATNAAQERLHALLRRYGQDAVVATMKDMLDYSAWLFRRKIAGIPEGQWLGECYLDHDGKTENTLRYAVTLRKDARGLSFDYRATGPQVSAFINSPFGGVLSATYMALFAYMCGDIPWNSGIMRHVHIISDEGALNNAKFPAPVSGALESIWNSLNAASAAVGKMLTCSDAQRDSAMAVWQGSTQVYNLFGTSQYGEPFGSMIILSGLGGGGARSFGDGHDNSGGLMAPRYSSINVEHAESLYPILYLYRKRAIDSGGPGAWRGGVSAESAVTPHHTEEIWLRLTSSGSNHSHTAGLIGGYPGGASMARVKRGAVNLGSAPIAADWAEIGGNEEALPAKASLTLVRGDVFSATPHGGGGYGDPLQRSAEQVRQDVVGGLVSVASARAIYGVVLDDAAHVINAAQTEQVRARIRAARSGPVDRAGHIERSASDRHAVAGETVGSLTRAHGAWHCAHCGFALAPERDNPKAFCARNMRPVGVAGPSVALRHGGDSPAVHLIEYCCPECAALLFVDQRLKNETHDWHDFNLSSH